MARDKKSLFEWLTGGAGNENDYSFDDLESGGSSYAPPTVRKIAPSRGITPTLIEEEAPEAEVDGELAVDVYQTPSHIVIKAMIAGVKPKT